MKRFIEVLGCICAGIIIGLKCGEKVVHVIQRIRNFIRGYRILKGKHDINITDITSKDNPPKYEFNHDCYYFALGDEV